MLQQLQPLHRSLIFVSGRIKLYAATTGVRKIRSRICPSRINRSTRFQAVSGLWVRSTSVLRKVCCANQAFVRPACHGSSCKSPKETDSEQGHTRPTWLQAVGKCTTYISSMLMFPSHNLICVLMERRSFVSPSCLRAVGCENLRETQTISTGSQSRMLSPRFLESWYRHVTLPHISSVI